MSGTSVPMPPLPSSFLERPIAHRGLHDLVKGIPENSLASFHAAISHGYGIELDLQLSADGKAVVFHDYVLDRLSEDHGKIRDRSSDQLARISLKGDENEFIPTLAQVLELVNGHVPILVEIKDQDGTMSGNIGQIEADIAEQISVYSGPIAVMSFNPHSVQRMQELAPDVPRGLTTYAWDDKDAKGLPDPQLASLRQIERFDSTQSCFISHDINSLRARRVLELKSLGVPILCWTVKSVKVEKTAREIADNVTFEGYLPT